MSISMNGDYLVTINIKNKKRSPFSDLLKMVLMLF